MHPDASKNHVANHYQWFIRNMTARAEALTRKATLLVPVKLPYSAHVRRKISWCLNNIETEFKC